MTERSDLPGVKRVKTYYVWRRSDGYVGVTARPPSNGRDTFDTFDLLLTTESWPEAHAKVDSERGVQHAAVVSSWANESDEMEQS